MLEFKKRVLAAHAARPATGYVAVPIDLRKDWPKALRQAGFDASRPTAWSAEGLLPYLSAADQDALFEHIDHLSAVGSRLDVEAFGPDFYSAEGLARRRARIEQAREAARSAGRPEVPDPSRLWYLEPRTDVARWLTERGWEVSTITAVDLMASHQRQAPEELSELVPDTTFVEAQKL